MSRIHRCDDSCACPVHGTPLIYWPAGDDHACQDVTCEYGAGGCRGIMDGTPPAPLLRAHGMIDR